MLLVTQIALVVRIATAEDYGITIDEFNRGTGRERSRVRAASTSRASDG
jgi:hypothetical protein